MPQTDTPPAAAVQAPAAIISGPETIEIHTRPTSDPGPGQLRIRLEGCGVCASNLPVWEGRDWFEYPQEPGAPGHEGWGRVDAIGAGVEGFHVGQRVAALSYHAYAYYDIAEASDCVPLPSDLEGVPFPAEPLGCAVNILRRCAIKEGQRVAIVGVGFIGALLVALCKDAGAEVTAITRRKDALEKARQMGADSCIEMDDHWRVIEEARKETEGSFYDCVIEATGVQWPLDLASELTRERGRLVIAGYHQDGPRQVNMQQWNWRGLDVINAHERDPAVYHSGMEAAVALVASGRFDPSPLYTHKLALEELPQAFQLMQERPEGFMKALLIYPENDE